MVRALVHRYKLLEPLNRSEDAVNAAITLGRHTRVMRMASDADLALVGHGDDAVRK